MPTRTQKTRTSELCQQAQQRALPKPLTTNGKPLGRPRLNLEPELRTRILDLISSGSNLQRIAAMPDMPSPEMLYRWLREDATFVEEYARAREARADARADRIDAIMDRLEAGDIDSKSAQVLIWGLQWQAGKEQPKRYGDTMRVEATLATSVTVGALAAGRRRIRAEEAQKAIEGEVIDAETV